METGLLTSTNAIGVVTFLATLMTALATFALWKATRQLVVATKLMADRTTLPHVVATIEPNQWSIIHFDLKITNVGQGAAYDIVLSFEPPLPEREGSRQLNAPLQKISILRPGQTLASYVASFEKLKDQSYTATITWKDEPTSSLLKSISYQF